MADGQGSCHDASLLDYEHRVQRLLFVCSRLCTRTSINIAAAFP